jgi:hypothetical protein
MSTPSPLFHSGFGGTAAVGTSPGTELPITEWSVRPTAKHATFQTSKNMGYDQVEANWKSATVTITVEYDFNNNPFISPTNIQIGTVLTNVVLYLHQSGVGTLDGPNWTFPSLLVTETNQSLQVNGGNIRVQITGVSNGTFTAPAV